ncbi:unnamed protein product [Dracunculus medinensis]|uniref:SHSP domain-containing protein n=1 Tax=Dracunculus medinensis TaxID=318479 RepID=A0A0N4UK74_DRAME|nr:unnamed protein product [Dracunculus medinensis]
MISNELINMEREIVEEEKWMRQEPVLDETRRASHLSSKSTSHLSGQTNFKDNAKYQEKAMFPNRTNLQTSRSRDNIPTSSSYIPEILSTNRSSVLNKPKEIVPFYTITKKKPTIHNKTTNDVRTLNFQHKSEIDSQHIFFDNADIINTDHGFTIKLDVKYFRPENLKVTLTRNILTVFGDRFEDVNSQTMRRTFTRKYLIPSDVRLSSIISYMTDCGSLVIKGDRKGWKETDLTVQPIITQQSNSNMISVV